MATATEIAVQLVGVLAEEVLAGRQRTYGFYAKAIGRSFAKEAIVVGPALHAIGAVCIIRQMPIPSLYYVTVADGEPKQVFSGSVLEAACVLPHFKKMYVVSREYQYKAEEFTTLCKKVTEIFAKHEGPGSFSPHELWKLVIVKKPKGNSQTYLERALIRYQEIFEEVRRNHSRH